MDTEKIRSAAREAVLTVLTEQTVVSRETLANAVSDAVAAAFDAYEKQDV